MHAMVISERMYRKIDNDNNINNNKYQTILWCDSLYYLAGSMFQKWDLLYYGISTHRPLMQQMVAGRWGRTAATYAPPQQFPFYLGHFFLWAISELKTTLHLKVIRCKSYM